MNSEELYNAILDFKLADDPIQVLMRRSQEDLDRLDSSLAKWDQLGDGEGISEMERLRRRVAVLEALLAEEGR